MNGKFYLTGTLLMKNCKYLKLKRPTETYNQLFSYQIYLGDQPIAKLKNGEEIIVEIPDSDESPCLYAKIQWCRSRKIPIDEFNIHKPILVRGDRFLNHDVPLFGALIPILGIGLIINMGTILQMVSLILIILLVLFMVGAFVLKRNNWIKLEF